MKPFWLMCFLLLAAGAATAHAQDTELEEEETAEVVATPAACCAITAISARTGIVTARERSTGRTFRFEVKSRALLRTLRTGQSVWANFAAKTVSVKPAEPVGKPSIKPAEPVGQPAAAPPCCSILPEVQP